MRSGRFLYSAPPPSSGDSSALGSWNGQGGKRPSRLEGMRRRRQLPYLVLGAVLVLVCAVGGVVVAEQIGHRESVLVLARSVSAGQELSARDVRVVGMSVDSGLDPVGAGSLKRVEGRAVAYSLPSGTLLTEQALGPARVPPPGEAVAAVGLKDGQFPSGLAPGARVTVVLAADQGTDDSSSADSSVSAGRSWGATVTSLRKSSEESTVVSLQMAQQDARQVAAAPAGQVSVVVAGGGR